MLRRALGNDAVRVALVAATSLLLVGHGGDTPDYDECEGAPYQSITFTVRGTCGEAGQIVVVADGGSCQMKVGGGWDVGLPDYGNRQGVEDGDLLNGGWEISGAPGRGSELGYTVSGVRTDS
jgi:hypothetical protein